LFNPGRLHKPLDTLTPDQIAETAQSSSGPREYETFIPEEQRRWKLVPYDIAGGFEDWFSLDDLFPKPC
jgi:hypothetical protein